MANNKATEEWKPECEGALHPIQMLAYHQNLEYCMTKKLLIQRQARWSELSRVNCNNAIGPGQLHRKADVSMRRPGTLHEGGDDRLNNMAQVILEPLNLPELLFLLVNSPPTQGHPSISELFAKVYIPDTSPVKLEHVIKMKNT